MHDSKDLGLLQQFHNQLIYNKMSEDFVPFEITSPDDHRQVMRKSSHPSWISMFQKKLVESNAFLGKVEHLSVENTVTVPIESQPLQVSLSKLTNSQQYFREDSGKNSIVQFDPKSNKYKTKPHEVIFRCNKFLRYFALRILFTLIGPLIILPGFYHYPWFNFMRNLRFLGNFKCTYYNYFRFLQNHALIVWILFFQTKSCCYYDITVFSLAYLIENIGIAINLAFFHPSRLELMEQYDLEFVGDSCESCIDPIQWAQQADAMIDKEVENSIKRMQVEINSFILYFMVNPPSDLQAKIKYVHPPEFKESTWEFAADGILMTKLILKEFNRLHPHMSYLKFPVVLAVLRFFVGIALDVLYKVDLDYGIMVQCKLVQLIYFALALSFVTLTIRDLKRKIYCMNQLTYLVSGTKVESYEDSKIFPTLNLLCVMSLFSWYNMRKVLLDYGLQYRCRQTFIIAQFIIINTIVMLVFMVLCYFELIDLLPSIQISIDFIIMSLVCTYAMLLGAAINQTFQDHKFCLRKNLFIVQQISVSAFWTTNYLTEPQDYIFQAIAEMMKNAEKESVLKPDEFMHYSQFSIRSIEHVFNDLTYQEKHKPFTVIGIAMTYELVVQLGLSAVGLIGTGVLNLIFRR